VYLVTFVSLSFFKIIFLLFLFGSAKAQIINGYADVISISGNSLNVSNVDEAFDTFENNEFIIIMQMQDNCIGSNTTNIAAFGDLSSIQSVGLYEIAQIGSLSEAAGSPTTIVLTTIPGNVYNVGTNSRVQIISFRLLGSPNYTTIGNHVAKVWNGTTGGVLALEVNGNLTLAHNLSANGSGFRGGAVSTNFYSGGTGCTTTEYIRTADHTRAGAKGEGIYRTAIIDFLYARGKLLNGGGGGSERINCGGGGGGNFTAGGLGGVGWSCGGPGGGGTGGLSLFPQISASRIFMGGGGGGGQQNDSQGSSGSNGGGIILIKANAIVTSTTCAGRSISANANTVTSATNDGQGGGGADGTIVLQTNGWIVPAGCQLTV